MRIVVDLQCCQNGSRSRGIGRYAMSLVRALLDRSGGHEFHIVLSDRFPDTVAPIRQALDGLITQDRIHVFALPANVHGAEPAHGWRRRAAEALREHFITTLRPDVVFLPSLFEGFRDDCVISIGRQPLRTAVTVHDLIPLAHPDRFATHPDERACYERMLLSMRRADRWLAVSEFSRAQACAFMRLPRQAVSVTSEGVDARFHPLPRGSAAEASRRTSLGKRLRIARPFVLFAGALDERKNARSLIEAWTRLDPAVRSKHQLVLVGESDPDGLARLQRAAVEGRVDADELVLTGHVADPDLVELYRLCSLFVFPSFYEGFGLPPLEAMACGAPVIASNATSLPEVIGLAEALFDPGDVAQLADIMERALTDEAFSSRLRDHGLDRSSRFSWSAAAAHALGAFEDLHAEPGAPGGSERPALAIVAQLADIAASGHAGRFDDLLRELSVSHEPVIISDQPGPGKGFASTLPRLGREAFNAEAGRFSRVLHDLAGASPDAAFAVAFPGVALTGERIGDAPRTLDPYVAYETLGYQALREQADVAAALALADEVIPISGCVEAPASPLPGRGVKAQRSTPGHASPADLARAVTLALERSAATGSRARTRRLIDTITAPHPVAPTDEDLAAVARCLAANHRPDRRSQLWLDVTAATDASVRPAPDWFAAVFRGLLEASSSWRVEPVRREGDGFVYARAFARSLGVGPEDIADEPVEALAGDFLVLTGVDNDPARLAALRDRGVRIAVYLPGDDILWEAPAWPLACEMIQRWTQTAARFGGAIHLLPAPAGEPRAVIPTSGLDRMWSAGIPVEALAAAAPGFSSGPSDPSRDRPAAPFHLFDDRDGQLSRIRATSIEAARQWREKLKGPVDYVVCGHLEGSYSLAVVNRAIARTIEAARPGQCRIAGFENGPLVDLGRIYAAERPLLEQLATRPPRPDRLAAAIVQHWPVMEPPAGDGVNLALFAWEESEVPHDVVAALSCYDAVLASSRFTAKALLDSGFAKPCVAIGQPAEIDSFCRLRRRPLDRDRFTFLHVSSAFPRKGVDRLLQAWSRAFDGRQDVRLIIKTFPNPHNNAAALVEGLRRSCPDHAPVELVDCDVDAETLLALYSEADAVVLPSRGEGFNLPALEAMAARIPLIVTAGGGHRDFCGPAEARLVRYRLEQSLSHVASDHALWFEPDVDDLVEALRETADGRRPDEHKARLDAARSAAIRAVDPSAWTDRLDLIVRTLATACPPPDERITWVSTSGVRCGIAEYSLYLLDALPAGDRANITLVCDSRVRSSHVDGLPVVAGWTIGDPMAWRTLADAIALVGCRAVVIQHQAGLLEWAQLTRLMQAEELSDRDVYVVLHNAVMLRDMQADEQRAVAAGLARARRVVVHTVGDANLLLSLGLSENVTCLPHGARVSDQLPPVRDLASAEAAPMIGCHGFFLPGKGIETLIRTLPQLLQVWPAIRLRLVNARFPVEASDRLIEECRQLADDLGVAGAIEWWTEFLEPDEINALLQECDVVAFAYEERTDSASGAIRLGLSSLVPVAATRVGIFAEFEGAVSWMADAPEAMAADLESLLKDAGARRLIQKAGHDWLRSRDWSRIGPRLLGLIKGSAASLDLARSTRLIETRRNRNSRSVRARRLSTG